MPYHGGACLSLPIARLRATSSRLLGARLPLLRLFGGEAATAGLGFLLGLALLGGERFLEPIFGDLHLRRVLFLGVGEVRALTSQKVLVRHGIVVIGVDLKRCSESRL